MPDGENTPPQPTASGTLDDAGSTREIRSNLVGPGISGSLRHPSQPFGTTQRASSGTDEIEDRRNRFETTPGESSGSLHARSQPPGTFQRATSGSSEIGERRGRLEAIVEGFRAGVSSRIDSVAEILQELESGPWLSSEEKDATFRLYYTEISEAESHPRGEANEPVGGTTAPHTGTRKERKRNHDNNSESESDGEDDSPAKKRRLKESEMPWAKYASATATVPNPSCTETIQLLKLYDNDIKGCKFHVNVASDAPENIPGSQWERIFKGEPVDLDQILSSLHHITLDEQRKTRLGGATGSVTGNVDVELASFNVIVIQLEEPYGFGAAGVWGSCCCTQGCTGVLCPRHFRFLESSFLGRPHPLILILSRCRGFASVSFRLQCVDSEWLPL